MGEMAKQRITQHLPAKALAQAGKRFPLIKSGAYGTHPNPALLRLGAEIACTNVDASQELFNKVAEMIKKCWTSFMLGTLYKMAVSKHQDIPKRRKICNAK